VIAEFCVIWPTFGSYGAAEADDFFIIPSLRSIGISLCNEADSNASAAK
jgi:hypothetical protein